MLSRGDFGAPIAWILIYIGHYSHIVDFGIHIPLRYSHTIDLGNICHYGLVIPWISICHYSHIVDLGYISHYGTAIPWITTCVPENSRAGLPMLMWNILVMRC